MYSPSSPDFHRSRTGSSSKHPKSPKHTRDSSLPSLPSLFNEDDDESVVTKESLSLSPSYSRRRLRPKKTQFERTLLQAHGLTAALFSCVPCQSMDGVGAANKKAMKRQGLGSYYLPTDLLDDSEVLPYIATAGEAQESGRQRYDTKRY